MKTKQQVSNTELLTCCLLLFLHYDWCSSLGGPCVCPARARGPPSTPRGLGLVVRGSAPAWDPQDSVDHRGLGLVVSWDPQVSGPPRSQWTPWAWVYCSAGTPRSLGPPGVCGPQAYRKVDAQTSVNTDVWSHAAVLDRRCTTRMDG